MYGLPLNFDSGFLVGRTLDQICRSMNTVTLHFEGDVHITIEGPYSYLDAAGEVSATSADTSGVQPDLTKLLGNSVLSANGTQEGTLRLAFRNGQRLECFDTPGYESYHIRHGERVIVV